MDFVTFCFTTNLVMSKGGNEWWSSRLNSNLSSRPVFSFSFPLWGTLMIRLSWPFWYSTHDGLRKNVFDEQGGSNLHGGCLLESRRWGAGFICVGMYEMGTFTNIIFQILNVNLKFIIYNSNYFNHLQFTRTCSNGTKGENITITCSDHKHTLDLVAIHIKLLYYIVL